MSIKTTIAKSFMSTGLALFLSIAANAAVPQWEIVQNESQLTFTATQNGAPVTGQFKTFSGTILVDPNDLKHSSINIIVDINSISASYAELKSTLLTPDWFNPKVFPKAEFKSNQIEKTGSNTYKAVGMLTIRDKTAPVTLNFKGEQPDPNKGIVIGNTVIQRTQFGVGQGDWASTNEIKDEVTINFKVVGVKK
ncbi:putative YceI-like family protein [Legionella gratiana]|uniref:YceI-like family protein n=1 Tax=Legionella gratiana TaxID=45066 RepID=A0A378JAJ6_9GAMM|nr:YceI family protein [Legionella gratiana]KTD15663.1 putative YceI-like family protein [Legionella gratiana]STX44802.1 putative YceI-like family protein [Legionella gratiana]